MQIDLSKTDDYEWATNFFNELRHKRKFALRLGRLAENEQAIQFIHQTLMFFKKNTQRHFTRK